MDVRHQGTGRGDERRGRGPLKGPRIEASLEPIGVTDYETHSRHPGKSHPHRGHRLHGLLVEVDLEPVEAVAERLAYIAEREDKPTGRPCEYDEFHFHHQVPGGMVSNLAYQLETLGLGHRIDEILEEAGRVRGDLGYPIVVSPFAQYIVTEATLNVMNAERYKVVPDEVRSYVLGRYGEIPGAIDPDLYDRIARGQEPAKERPGSLLPPTLERGAPGARAVQLGRRFAAGGFLQRSRLRGSQRGRPHRYRLSAREHAAFDTRQRDRSAPRRARTSFHSTAMSSSPHIAPERGLLATDCFARGWFATESIAIAMVDGAKRALAKQGQRATAFRSNMRAQHPEAQSC